MCPINDGVEDTKHYLLLCHSFEEQQSDLLAGVLPVLRSFEFIEVLNHAPLQILFIRQQKVAF